MATLLGIETSCDECSAAVVRHSPRSIEVLSVSTFSQVKIHAPYGGVVPEIASRNHLETINPMIDRALKDARIRARDLDAIAVTNRPGLVGALLVGLSAGKALAYAIGKPLVPVHHLEGHAASIYLDHPRDPASEHTQLPMLLAIISGAHTNLYVVPSPPELWPPDLLRRSLIGRSRDDAAGEAFDKTAKILGFPYPGGVQIDRASEGGNPKAFDLPRALPQKSVFDYSFSGLKTAVALLADRLRRDGKLEAHLADVCASVQEAIVDALLGKIWLAVERYDCKSLAIVGGVAANRRLRAKLSDEWKVRGLLLPPILPKPAYCTDNAAMIGAAGVFRYRQNHVLRNDGILTLNAIANPEV